MSLWDTLLIPADKLQQLRTDAAAARPTHAGFHGRDRCASP